MTTVNVKRGKVRMGRTMLKAGIFLPWAVMRPSRKADQITVTSEVDPNAWSAADHNARLEAWEAGQAEHKAERKATKAACRAARRPSWFGRLVGR